jgi:hypothetical protein
VIIEHTSYAANASSSMLARLTDTATVLEVMEAQGYDPDALPVGARIPLANISPSIVESIKSRTPIWFETNGQVTHPLLPKEKLESALLTWGILPVNGREGLLGALLLSIPSESAPSDDDKAFLITLTQQSAQALERALLYEQAKDVAACCSRPHRLLKSCRASGNAIKTKPLSR